MKFLNQVFILLSLFLSIQCNTDNKITDNEKKELPFKAIFNGKVTITDGYLYKYNYEKCQCDSIIITYSEKGTTFTDFNDYEDKFERVFFITIPTDFKCLTYQDKELLDANAHFIWNCYSKEPLKEKRNIEKGIVEICKNDDGSLFINIDVDTEFKFGGFLSNESTNKIKVKEVRIDIDTLSNL